MNTSDIFYKCTNCIYLGSCDKQPETCNEGIMVGTLLPEEAYMTNNVEIGIGLPKTKSHLKVGNLIIHNTHHFNWLERKMWKLLLGFDIEHVEE